MKKEDLLKYAVNITSYITDIPDAFILSSSKTSEVVDARYLVVHILNKKGLYPNEIAKVMKCTATNIRIILSRLYERAKGNYSFRMKLKTIDKELEKDNSVFDRVSA